MTVEILKQFPHPATVRARIAALDAEATFLRRLMRMLRHRPPSAGPLPVNDEGARPTSRVGPQSNGTGKGVPHAD
jgi:hypothetical protein